MNESRAAFTLIEIMVALVAGAIAITSIYFVSSASARHFNEQQRIAQSQMSLRMAMEQIRRDFGRAGYLGTPNTSREQRCVDSPWAFGAVALENAETTGTAALGNATTNKVDADRVELIGNFATSDAYLMIDAGGSGNRASLQQTWQGFRRSFGVPPYTAALFTRVFDTERYVHITTPTGNHFFAAITAVNASSNPPSVEFSPALPIGSACVPGLCDGCTIAPISRIEYAVLDATATSATSSMVSSSPAAAATGMNGAVLVRREVGMGAAGAAIANSERVIAEYVADFDVDFITNTNITVGTAPTLVVENDAAAETRTQNEPHLLRSAIVRLSVRTASEDPRFPFVSRVTVTGSGSTSVGPLTRFEVNSGVPGAARVRTAATEILLPNLAMRDIRP